MPECKPGWKEPRFAEEKEINANIRANQHRAWHEGNKVTTSHMKRRQGKNRRKGRPPGGA